ncbi:hypothetical protein [Streptomyces sp. NPDC057460]|uniref:hypothetical protein n=1 Tax=Streptomyces sp. NPDC057460 TaxID=3346141 RepID=UPI003689881E
MSEKEVDRSRQLSGGPSAHTHDLRDAAYEMYRALGLQRARVRGSLCAASDPRLRRLPIGAAGRSSPQPTP